MNRTPPRLALAAALALGAAARAADPFPAAADLPARPAMPDPLVSLDGRRVRTPDEWRGRRRPELQALVQHYLYGTLPPPAKVRATVEHEDRGAFAGKATLREVALAVGPAGAPPVRLLLVVPNRRAGPAPVFLGLNFCGNHALVKDPCVRLPTAWMYPGQPGVEGSRATEAGRGAQADVWALEQSVGRGYAVATFYDGDVDPDRPDARGGLRPFLAPAGRGPGPHDAGTVAAWAWGLHRAVDYLVTLEEVDARRVAVVGHSRLGKAALLAAAFDERIALAVPHQAGCGGTAPSRGTVGESVKQINDRFPHWFAGAFKEFNGRPERLPFDQNGVVALVAPRPVLLGNAAEDAWADPGGQFEVLRAAEPVYRLLGAGGLESDKVPASGRLLGGRLGYFVRPGKHSMTAGDWRLFLDFADRHLGKPAAPR